MNASSLLPRILLLLSALAVPMGLAAEDPQAPKHHHYKLIDLGTFGGPTSGTTDELQVLNHRGMVAGTADTSVPNHPNSCIFCGGASIAHAFLWSNCVLHDLRSLPGINTSDANWISDTERCCCDGLESRQLPGIGQPIERHAPRPRSWVRAGIDPRG